MSANHPKCTEWQTWGIPNITIYSLAKLVQGKSKKGLTSRKPMLKNMHTLVEDMEVGASNARAHGARVKQKEGW